MLISLTVGKVDAGLAILLTEDKRLIEFPSILLPPGITSGSIVDIQVSRNAKAEAAAQDAFSKLQDEIFNQYGVRSPKKPVLRVRNATQTSIVLEWDPIDLATATLRSLTLYRNNSKAGNIPNPTAHTTTKISGLAVDTEYIFHLVLKTSAGTYASEKVSVKTHKMTDLSGITVCPGVMPAEVRESLEACLERIGARPLQDKVRIDTTHFVCTEGRGHLWERAQEMNIPVVRPEWLEACEREGRIVVARQFYLGADLPKVKHSVPIKHTSAQSAAPQSPASVTSPRGSVAQPAEQTPTTPGDDSPGPVSSPRQADHPADTQPATPAEKEGKPTVSEDTAPFEKPTDSPKSPESLKSSESATAGSAQFPESGRPRESSVSAECAEPAEPVEDIKADRQSTDAERNDEDVAGETSTGGEKFVSVQL